MPASIESRIDGALRNCFDSGMPKISTADATGNPGRKTA